MRCLDVAPELPGWPELNDRSKRRLFFDSSGCDRFTGSWRSGLQEFQFQAALPPSLLPSQPWLRAAGAHPMDFIRVTSGPSTPASRLSSWMDGMERGKCPPGILFADGRLLAKYLCSTLPIQMQIGNSRRQQTPPSPLPPSHLGCNSAIGICQQTFQRSVVPGGQGR